MVFSLEVGREIGKKRQLVFGNRQFCFSFKFSRFFFFHYLAFYLTVKKYSLTLLCDIFLIFFNYFIRTGILLSIYRLSSSSFVVVEVAYFEREII